MSSLKEVAEIAGVSPATVSRVMNNTVFVSDATREKVEAAIEKINYKPNIIAQSLRLKATKNIGLLVPEISHASFILVVKHIVDSAAKRGLNTIVCNTDNDVIKEAHIIDKLIRQSINGIIFIRVSDESHIVNVSKSTKVPMIVLDRAFNNENIPNITIDNYFAGTLAAKHLISKGRKKIATITGKFNISLSRDRHQGFIDTLKKHGIEVPQKLIYQGGFTYQAGVDGVLNFIENNLEFDGLWGQNDLIAAGAMSTLLHHNKRVPQDVSIVGMDNVQFSSYMYPSITTIAQPYEAMCDKAVELIDKLTNNEVIEENHFSFPPSLIVRESS